MIAAIIIWNVNYPIDWFSFLIATLGGIVDVLSICFLYKSLSKGPGGPITAICSTPAVFALVIECVKTKMIPTWVEFVGLALGLIGALEFVIP